MFSLQRTLSSGSLAQAYRFLAQAESQQQQRCVILLCQQQRTQNYPNHSSARHQSSAVHQLHHQGQGQKVLSTSGSSSAQAVAPGAKGRTLPPYMVFRYCQPASIGQHHQSTAGHSTLAFDLTNADQMDVAAAVTQEVATVATRPLVLLFAWMLSKNKQIEKYREFWIKRGYDILTVQTSPIDLLVPSIGGKKVATNVYNFLSKITPRYDEVIVHAFSVGGYQLGELLDRLYAGIERQEPEAERLYRSLKGFLIDSVVFADDAAPGLSRAITLNPVVQPVLEKSIASWLAATRRHTYDRYKLVESHIIDNKRRVPSMLLFSKDDVVSNFRSNYGVVDGWERKGIATKAMCWDTSAHVLHYREHPEEYETVVDGFIKRMNITKALVRN